jgi:hypothetical protein
MTFRWVLAFKGLFLRNVTKIKKNYCGGYSNRFKVKIKNIKYKQTVRAHS